MKLTVSAVAEFIESWAPKHIAWERDNVGLQVGNPASQVLGILVSLDVTPATLHEARQRGANLIISHHPLLFKPVHALVSGMPAAECIQLAAKHGIAVYAAHTNLDFTTGGTSFALAGELGLEEIDFLHRPYKTKRKIVTYVPPDRTEVITNAMADSGAGIIGNYDHCSFRIGGTGTFRGNSNARPRTGEKERLEQVDEVRLEMIVDSWNVGSAVDAMLRAHPYEEAAYEVYPVENVSREFGMGCVGTLKRPLRQRAFLQLVRNQLDSVVLRSSRGSGRTIRRVAVCGGSGSELLEEAIRQKADAFVTADVKYHAFHDADTRILLVDAGHYETEFPVVRSMAGRIKKFLYDPEPSIPVVVSRKSVNPIMYA